MNSALLFLSTVFVSFPSLVAGYIFAAAASGFRVGRFIYEREENAAIDRHGKD